MQLSTNRGKTHLVVIETGLDRLLGKKIKRSNTFGILDQWTSQIEPRQRELRIVNSETDALETGSERLGRVLHESFEALKIIAGNIGSRVESGTVDQAVQL